ncbi:MAG: hypothetical protein JWM76_2740 [Pseudonocardiales bacterium]|nr:hypothetical protein [Pseudonocardiales bacterium]
MARGGQASRVVHTDTAGSGPRPTYGLGPADGGLPHAAGNRGWRIGTPKGSRWIFLRN